MQVTITSSKKQTRSIASSNLELIHIFPLKITKITLIIKIMDLKLSRKIDKLQFQLKLIVTNFYKIFNYIQLINIISMYISIYLFNLYMFIIIILVVLYFRFSNFVKYFVFNY